MSDNEEVMTELEKLHQENGALKMFYAKAKATTTLLSALPSTTGVGVSNGGLGSSGSSNVMVSFNNLEVDAGMIVQSFTAINKTAVRMAGNNSTISNTAPINMLVMNMMVGGSKVQQPLHRSPHSVASWGKMWRCGSGSLSS